VIRSAASRSASAVSPDAARSAARVRVWREPLAAGDGDACAGVEERVDRLAHQRVRDVPRGGVEVGTDDADGEVAQ